ncbi:MAG: MotA/TolQ/ExbB proton channel family protein [Neisseria sp.]|uniref:MotA/TolQ/ExbB proton channel family protein n=1 Tax=Neisseria sp. TaxID=192066 RepID=UPI0026DC9902|nr:MotA/TolQ/ExbB proton channel family protein [Neisseria sp.]MDO4249436.1 MotA/TolQ/ExbB proton channel family protein [Neisseria sp.]
MNLMLVFQQGDPVLIGVFLVLVLMSIVTWTIIIWKVVVFWKLRREDRAARDSIWASDSLNQAVSNSNQYTAAPSVKLMRASLESYHHYRSDKGSAMAASLPFNDYLTSRIRHHMSGILSQFDQGLTPLASIGATAPFIGLFGTVWGIYHALINISNTGQMNIAAVAGPIGEALVATAAGLFVAIPAVLAYNALVRKNKVVAQDLDHFAHDLYVQLLNNKE